MSSAPELPIAIIGAGPVGLAAASHLIARGLKPLVLERGASVGSAMLEWSHVRVFSPWRYNIDTAAGALLDRSGWQAPDQEVLPTGGEIVSQYLRPLAAVPEIADNLVLGATVTAIAREGHDKVSSINREKAAFVIHYTDITGAEHQVRAGAVIDASGTWTQPNPLGVNGLPVPGEKNNDRIAYGIPDVVGKDRGDYIGKRVLVVGSGHSAINVALALMELQQQDPATEIVWALRRNRLEKLLGGGLNDELPERGALGLAAKRAIDDGRLRMLAPFAVERVDQSGADLRVTATVGDQLIKLTVDRIVVATGFRPDLSFLREVRLWLDPTTEAPPQLAPLIDPNIHSCGTVPPHGIAELTHPEPDFVIVGSKSYGRAPTFLMLTGYEQVRSVVAHLAGDHEAARKVELVLPETGVCSAEPVVGEASSGCCGGPAPDELDACCVADAVAKQEGQSGCGCGSAKSTKVKELEAAQ